MYLFQMGSNSNDMTLARTKIVNMHFPNSETRRREYDNMGLVFTDEAGNVCRCKYWLTSGLLVSSSLAEDKLKLAAKTNS